MKITRTITILILLAVSILTSCKTSAPTPIVSATPVVKTATPTAIALTETSTALPTFSFDSSTVIPSPKPLLPTEIFVPVPGGIVYYHFVNLAQSAPPQGSVVVMPESLVLAPTQLTSAYGSDVAADLQSALDAVLTDKRNYWFGDQLQISQLTFGGGHADIVLEGDYYAVAPVVLSAARAQILMTLFANEAVQSATVMLNGDNIANISISNSRDAKPADTTYTRAEIESFMSENAYAGP